MRRAALLLSVSTACSPVAPFGEGSTGGDVSTAGQSSTLEVESNTSLSDSTSGETGPGMTSVAGSSSSGSDFIVDPEGGCFALPPGVLAHCTECSFWDQDCMVGHACKPWANDGGTEWNAARCGPVDVDPGQPGDPCEPAGSSWSGIDSCDVGALCWSVDPETALGECVALCDGTKYEPSCPGGGTCVLANDGFLPLCLPACDPLAPSCDEGEGCYPGTYDDFVCLRQGDGVYTDAPHPTCNPGSFALVDGTCVAFCDLTAKEPCEAGSVCTPYFEGKAPAEYVNIGACVPAM